MVLETVREACRMRLDNLMIQKQTDNKKKTSVCLLAELEREKQRVEDNAIQLYREYASGGYSKEGYLSLRKSNQSLLGELEEKITGITEQESEPESEESEDDLKQCSMLEESGNYNYLTVLNMVILHDFFRPRYITDLILPSKIFLYHLNYILL